MQLAAQYILAAVHWHGGRVTEGLPVVEAAIELNRQDPALGTQFWGFSHTVLGLFEKACMLMWRGRHREAAVWLERAMEVASERNEHQLTSQCFGWMGPALEELTGTSQHALARGLQGVERAEASGGPFERTLALLHLGWAQLMLGSVAEALETLQRVDHLQRERGIAGFTWNLGQGLLAEAHLAASDAVRARTVANRCTAARDTWVYELRAHLSRARVLRALDGPNARIEIEASLARAQLLLEQSGAQAFAPFIVEERARLCEVLGDTKGAACHLREAQRLFAEVEATGHAERLAKEIDADPKDAKAQLEELD
jgi:tetratricopeptide (TPR) repeat protein